MDETLARTRCQTVRPIVHHAGTIPRGSTGMIRWATENLGRNLMRVDLDSGKSLVLLAEDVALEAISD